LPTRCLFIPVGSTIFIKKKKFRNAKSDPKFGRRGVVLVITLPGKMLWNAVLACVLLRKNFLNGVSAHFITKILLPVGMFNVL
jgi:hypothetical protein